MLPQGQSSSAGPAKLNNMLTTVAHRQLHCAGLWHPVAVGVLGQVQRHTGAVRGATLPEGSLEGQLNLAVSQVAF